MKIPKIDVPQAKLDINLKFYFFLKYIVKAKLNATQIADILKEYHLFNVSKDLENFKQYVLSQFNKPTKSAKNQYDNLSDIFIEIDNDLLVNVFVFSLKLFLIKDLLLKKPNSKPLIT